MRKQSRSIITGARARSLLLGDTDAKTGKPKKDSARPINCQKGLKTVCGIDIERAR
jgi:hypothetical protein